MHSGLDLGGVNGVRGMATTVVVVIVEAGRACPKGRSRSHKTVNRAKS